ncbi:hypothetical protein [Pseudomonas fragi]|uniref:hypothetical protein n=1 Tax=Pseudomonas fragi TaxID=296 RepID=UPI001474D27C|nr:hypothetical protein [Pseudomonas fragi]NNB33896.1 hypothetical protein [Pseudomonas fragi]
MNDLTNPDVLAVNLPGEFLDKLTRYAQEDAKLAALAAADPMDREAYIAQRAVSQGWAAATAHLLLYCLQPPEGSALAEAKLSRSDAWLKTQGDAPPMVFAPDLLDKVRT